MGAQKEIINEKQKAKAELRLQFRAAALSALSERKVHEEAFKNLKTLLKPGSRVATFVALKDELDILTPLQKSQIDIKLCYPKVEGQDLKFFESERPTTQFVANSLGVFEPHSDQALAVDLHKIDVMLVPGVSFDRKCRRLGRGKGYYDRALALFNGLKIGVCCAAQLSARDLPHESHDVVMDFVVTENFILKRIES